MAGKKFDLGAIVKRETDKGPLFTITAGGKTFSVAQRTLWPDDAIEAARNDDPIGAAKALLGKDYAAYVKAGGTAALLMALIDEALGVSSPESKASTDS